MWQGRASAGHGAPGLPEERGPQLYVGLLGLLAAELGRSGFVCTLCASTHARPLPTTPCHPCRAIPPRRERETLSEWLACGAPRERDATDWALDAIASGIYIDARC